MRLPTEIIIHIFQNCLSEFTYPSALQAPLLLTGVCRRWREVAVNMPSLWCRLSVMVALSSSWRPQASGYDLWLKRSRGYPLSLALFCNNRDAIKMQRLLRPYVNQILSLRLTFYEGTTLPELLLDNLPALQELAILQGAHDSNVEVLAIGHSIPRVPSTVRSLKIVDRFFHTVPLTSFGPVAAHLTYLDISTLRYPSAVLQLLHLCPSLASLKITVTFYYGEPLVFRPFTHPKIQMFHISHGSFDAQNLSALVEALSFPSLRVLEDHLIDIGGPPCRRPHKQWKAFLARSKCPLETLIFSGWKTPTVTDVEEAEYIALIPSLEIQVVDPSTI
ncbi:hypothetical protein DEU56DRAFT_884346 [Suillus clintonianus]|uniref:uncharacterized protein n=1 Tax=Suillus clintonianus TaxID=1904413 RepID=UPI001B87E250|nr:uncharacterized protein DEU56DRAFT_884346 [Suillus clintonianus]KAG2143692.1 hypothetical protein DEU56DRAFT_884346 [Suillus clintonianus]